MKKFLSAKLSGNILISLLIILLFFHVLVLVKAIPFKIVWGGQVNNPSSILIYEGMSVLITIIFIIIISMKIDYINPGKFSKIVNAALWFVFVYFLFNTIGNLTSGVIVEKLIFTPVTIIMTILAFRLAIEK
jgi:hypothetical protein